MNDKVICVLVIEDNPADARLVREKLALATELGWELPRFEIEHVERLQAALTRLKTDEFDVVLSDLDLPDSRAGETVATLRKHIPQMPLVVLTGREDEALAHKTVRAGVQDYLYKTEVTGSLLARTLMYAIERQQVHAELEQRVEARTAELRQVNEGLHAEIEKRLQAEDALGESERRYRELFVNSRDGFVMVDPQARFLDANPAYCQMLGYTLDELKQKADLYEITPSRWHAWEREEIWEERLLKRGYSGLYEKEYIHKDGTVFPVALQSHASLDEDGNARYLWAIARDITKQKRMEEELRGSEARYRSLYESIRDAILVTDVHRNIVSCNPSFTELFGYTLEEIKGKQTRYIYEQEEEFEQLGEALEAHKGEPNFFFTIHYRKKSGQVFLGETNVFYRKDSEGNVVGFIGLIRDVTARRQAEEVLQRRVRQLALLNKVGEQMGAMLALNSVLDKAARLVQQTFKYCHVGIFILNREQGEFMMRAKAGDFAELFPVGHRLELGQGMVGWVGRYGKKLLANDVKTEPHYVNLYPDIVPTRAELSVPIWGEDEIIGVLDVQSSECGAFDENDVMVMEILAGQLGVAVQNAWLYEAAQAEIAERKRAEQALVEQTRALQESEARFRAIFETAQDAIFMKDRDLTYTMVNPAMEALFGLPQSELIGKSDRELFGRHAAVHIEKVDGRVLAGEIVEEDDTKPVRPGELRTFHVIKVPVRDESGRVVGLCGIARDITERKQTEETLRIKDNAIETSINAIAMADLSGKLTYVNNAFLELWGYTERNEVLGRSVVEFWQYPEQAANVVKALESADGWRGELVATKKDGSLATVQLSASLVMDQADEPVCMMSSFVDISERKQVEESLARYATDLKHSNEELEQFGYVISHDLRAPLRVVRSYLQLLKEGYDAQLDARAKEYIAGAVDGAERMQKMIRALLNLSRVDTRGRTFAPTDCEQLLQGVLANLSLTIAEQEVQMTHDPLPTVSADQAQLAEVFQNLIANAIKFRREDVTPHVHISAEQTDARWTFSVADNGIGIEAGQREEIFQIFQRLHTETEYPGLGIGLALCKRIVVRHSGQIWLESELGKGSTFYFTIPKRLEDV